MSFSAYMPSIKDVVIGTKYVFNGLNNENFKMFSDAYDDSVTNSACINDITNLIVGEGLYNKKEDGLNPKITLSDTDLQLIVLDYKIQGSTTIQVIWRNGKPVKMYHVPVESNALNVNENMDIDGVWYSYDWTKKYKFVPKFYPIFDGKEPKKGVSILRIVRPSNEPLYPRPNWYPALRWAQDEGLMAQHSYRDIKDGFSGQKVINWVGGRSLTEEQKKLAAKEIREKFAGIDGQRLIVSINGSVENSIVVDNISPPNVNATYVNYTEEAERKILIAHSYPAILLAGAKTGFSSNADEIAVATKSVFRRVINPDRSVLIDGISQVYKLIDSSTNLYFKDFEESKTDENK